METVSNRALPTTQSLVFRQGQPVVWPPCLSRVHCYRSGQTGLNPTIQVSFAIPNQFHASLEMARSFFLRAPQAKHGSAHSDVSRCLILVKGVKFSLFLTRHFSSSLAAINGPSQHELRVNDLRIRVKGTEKKL
jgi:hypothetical protein